MKVVLQLVRDSDNSYPGSVEVSDCEELVVLDFGGRRVTLNRRELLFALRMLEEALQ